MITYPDLVIELIDSREYDFAINILRDFFRSRGFIETPVQHRISILAACENPGSIAKYDYGGCVWPLPQTGQMWLEWELLKNPKLNGFYCISTSYRNEYKITKGRHNRIFPMFEFETHGTMEDLAQLEIDLMKFVGIKNHNFLSDNLDNFPRVDYLEIAKKYKVYEIGDRQELRIQRDCGDAVLLQNFPEHTSPFWNMKRENGVAKKIDVIINGIETIGSAERSCDPVEMRNRFMSITDGNYAETLFYQFTKKRVLKELNSFLSLDFFPRIGGGIGMNRFIRALKLQGIMPDFK